MHTLLASEREQFNVSKTMRGALLSKLHRISSVIRLEIIWKFLYNYECLHVNFHWFFLLRVNVCTSRVTCESIERFQGVKGRKMWAERASKLAIVLVDCGTTSSDISTPEDTGLPLLQLRDAIHKVIGVIPLIRTHQYETVRCPCKKLFLGKS